MTDNKLPETISINNDTLSITPDFQTLLNKINTTVQHASNLVTVQTVDKLDENSLMATINDLSDAQKLAKVVISTRRDLKRYLKSKEDIVLKQFDDKVDQAHYKELSNLNAKAKDLKKDLSAYRINKRWKSLETIFNKNIQNYPIIHTLAPSLENFDIFRIRHPKLVTGAKSWKLGDKQIGIINQDLYDINECLTDLQTNELHLEPTYQNIILQNFVKNPTKDNYYKIKSDITIQRQNDIKLASAPVISKPKVNTLSLQDKSRKWLADYVSVNYKYRDISNNDDTKVKLIYDLIHALDNPSSEFYNFINSNKDESSKLLLNTISQIINV